MIRELDLVRLVDALTEPSVPAGRIGTVVAVYASGAAYEVEFVTPAGGAIGVVTLKANQIQEISKRASVEKFRAALALVPDVEPPHYDRLQ